MSYPVNCMNPLTGEEEEEEKEWDRLGYGRVGYGRDAA